MKSNYFRTYAKTKGKAKWAWAHNSPLRHDHSLKQVACARNILFADPNFGLDQLHGDTWRAQLRPHIFIQLSVFQLVQRLSQTIR